jgi:hypothetical protein
VTDDLEKRGVPQDWIGRYMFADMHTDENCRLEPVIVDGCLVLDVLGECVGARLTITSGALTKVFSK